MKVTEAYINVIVLEFKYKNNFSARNTFCTSIKISQFIHILVVRK